MPTKRTVEVTLNVEVVMDDSKFDETFMREFRETMFQLHTLDEHAEHLAWLAIRERLDDFTEGYGTIANMGIKVSVRDDVATVSVIETEPVAEPA